MPLLPKNRATYLVRQNASGQWYFVLKAANGEPVCTSEAYTTKDDAKRGAKSHRKAARTATVEVA
jgi:uncharacterized protein YegP (UPF0339 family)